MDIDLCFLKKDSSFKLRPGKTFGIHFKVVGD